MFTKQMIAAALAAVFVGLGAAVPVAMAEMRADEMMMPAAMPMDKNKMVSKKDYLEAAGKMWDKAAADMKVKDMKMMTMEEYKSFYDSYLKR